MEIVLRDSTWVSNGYCCSLYLHWNSWVFSSPSKISLSSTSSNPLLVKFPSLTTKTLVTHSVIQPSQERNTFPKTFSPLMTSVRRFAPDCTERQTKPKDKLRKAIVETISVSPLLSDLEEQSHNPYIIRHALSYPSSVFSVPKVSSQLLKSETFFGK